MTDNTNYAAACASFDKGKSVGVEVSDEGGDPYAGSSQPYF